MSDTQAVPQEDLGVRLLTANHVGIAVRDLDRSIAFYRALTGQEPFVQEQMQGIEPMYGPKVESQVEHVHGGARLRYATVRLANINIDIIQFEEPEMGKAVAGPTDQGSMHLCFEVENLDEVYERMTEAGIQFDAPPFTFGDSNGSPNAVGTRVAYFSDPDGVNLELITPAGSFARGQ